MIEEYQNITVDVKYSIQQVVKPLQGSCIKLSKQTMVTMLVSNNNIERTEVNDIKEKIACKTYICEWNVD